jgi:hypothetical protein
MRVRHYTTNTTCMEQREYNHRRRSNHENTGLCPLLYKTKTIHMTSIQLVNKQNRLTLQQSVISIPFHMSYPEVPSLPSFRQMPWPAQHSTSQDIPFSPIRRPSNPGNSRTCKIEAAHLYRQVLRVCGERSVPCSAREA